MPLPTGMQRRKVRGFWMRGSGARGLGCALEGIGSRRRSKTRRSASIFGHGGVQ